MADTPLRLSCCRNTTEPHYDPLPLHTLAANLPPEWTTYVPCAAQHVGRLPTNCYRQNVMPEYSKPAPRTHAHDTAAAVALSIIQFTSVFTRFPRTFTNSNAPNQHTYRCGGFPGSATRRTCATCPPTPSRRWPSSWR